MHEVKVPRLGQGMESGTVVRWLKAEGDDVKKGEPLYELDTEKVTQEVEAEADGTLLGIAVREGEVPVGTTIAYVGSPGEEIPEQAEAPAKAAEPAREEAPAREAVPVAAAATQANGRVKASPLARRIARERGIDLASLSGTGPEGRIVAEDVERAAAQGPAPLAPTAPVAAGEVERIPLTNVRRTIARRLTEAWTIPVFQLTVSADMSRANEVVRLHREANPDVRLTVTDVLTKVCARALLRHPAVNAQYTDEAILRFPTANVGIAAATPSGLYVPVIRSAELLSLDRVAAARADLVTRAREGKLRAEDLEDGTFTISNLGMPQYGIEQFVAVLNPPQAAILAVGATIDGRVTMTGTFDHRAIDGADGAEFLHTVKTYLEEPGLAL